jgi:hypothetical protein
MQTGNGWKDVMTRSKLAGILAGTAVALALPLHAAAYAITFTYTPSTTTHGASSYVSTTNTADPSKTITSILTDEAPGETNCAWGQSCSPAAGTAVGTSNVTAHWALFLCASSTQTFTLYWIQPDGGYTPPSGSTVVAEVQIKNSNFVTFDAYVYKDASGNYHSIVPSVPNLACHSSTYAAPNFSQTLGSYNGTTYNLHTNPSTVGSNTDTMTITYSDGTKDSASSTWSTT